MLERLEQKSSTQKEQEILLSDLMHLIKKFQSQLNVNFQEDLFKISSNKKNSELLLKLNLNDTSRKNTGLKIKNRLN
jgi:hypothetical protein